MSILEIILAFTTVFFGYFCFKFAIAVLRVQEAIEDSLDAIDQKYQSLSEILKIPVFFDSPEIKRIVEEIYEVRLSILYVAERLSNSVEIKEKIEEESEETEEVK
jgi:hypothetical protein